MILEHANKGDLKSYFKKIEVQKMAVNYNEEMQKWLVNKNTMEHRQKLSENGDIDYKTKIISMFLQLCQAINYCHDKQIPHRDLTPASILLKTKIIDGKATKEVDIKLCDFGVTKQFKMTPEAPDYMCYAAPEHFKEEKMTFAYDVWALGVIFYEMLTLKRPFDNQQEIEECGYDS